MMCHDFPDMFPDCFRRMRWRSTDNVSKIYPTKPSGEEWYMSMDDPRNYPRTSEPSMTKNSDGSWRVASEQVKYGVFNRMFHFISSWILWFFAFFNKLTRRITFPQSILRTCLILFPLPKVFSHWMTIYRYDVCSYGSYGIAYSRKFISEPWLRSSFFSSWSPYKKAITK
jgi:hypothetical protein